LPQVAYTPELCDATDPTNTEECCDTDLKAIFIEMNPAAVVQANSVPDYRAASNAVAQGVNITGVFGTGADFDLQVIVSGQQSVNSLSTGVSYAGKYINPWSCRLSPTWHLLP
jgi:hypothetical protein